MERLLKLQILFGLFFCTISLQITDVLEGSCLGMRNNSIVDINWNWITNTQVWYGIGGSKFHYYRTTLIHFDGDEVALQNIREDKFYYESCIQLRTEKGATGITVFTGYEANRRSYYNEAILSPGVATFSPIFIKRASSDWAQGTSTHYITLTDNSTFIVWTACFSNVDQRAWAVYSSVPELSEESISMIEKHAINMGYDSKNFAFFKYESCRPGVLNPDLVEGEFTSKQLESLNKI